MRCEGERRGLRAKWDWDGTQDRPTRAGERDSAVGFHLLKINGRGFLYSRASSF